MYLKQFDILRVMRFFDELDNKIPLIVNMKLQLKSVKHRYR